LFSTKQFDKASGKIKLKHGKCVLENKIGEVVTICILDLVLYKLGKTYYDKLKIISIPIIVGINKSNYDTNN
jgi:uncharacterized membrane protein